MYASRRPRLKSAVFFFFVASVLLVACGVSGTNTNWPGLSTDGDTVYIAYGPGIRAFDASTQEEVWSYQPESAGIAFYAAPSVQDGRVIFGDYGTSSSFSPQVKVTLYERSVTSDGESWTATDLVTGKIVAPPLQVGNTVYVGTGNSLVYAVDADSSKLLWPEPFETGHSIWGKPAFKDGILYVTSLDKTVYALEAETGKEKWHRELGGALASSPVVNLDLLYVASFDNRLYALDLETGEEVWSATAADWIWGAPAYDDGVVYFADAKGNVYAVGGESGESRWMHAIDRPVQTSPVVFGETVYVGSEADAESGEGLLTALDAQTGDELWQKRIPSPLHTTPVIVDDVLVVAIQSETTLLMAFDLDTGDPAWDIPRPASQR